MPDLSYRSTLKPVEVEELIDLAVHRPFGYVIARAAYPTSITPDQLTLLSMAVGILAGALLWWDVARGTDHLPLAGALFILSAVIDCSDGQLARMRQSSSVFGRMLDGAVDSIVQIAVVPPVVVLLLKSHTDALLPWAVLSVVAIWTGLQHTTLYDHFKNVYLHHIQATRKEGDDVDEVEASYRHARARGLTLLDHLRFFVYRNYVPAQRRLLARVDPYVPASFSRMQPYDPLRAERFRELHRGLMRAWSFYGIGTHIFGLGVAMIAGRVELYILGRLTMNLALVGLIPWQRGASKRFFAEHPPVESP